MYVASNGHQASVLVSVELCKRIETNRLSKFVVTMFWRGSIPASDDEWNRRDGVVVRASAS